MSRAREQMLAWTGLVRAASHLVQEADAWLKDNFGVSFAEKSLLGQLAIDRAEIPMVALSERLNITKAGMTKLVDRLEQAGLVRRQPSVQDRRAICVILTAKGSRLHQRIKASFVPWIASHFGDHLTVAELRALQKALLKVVEAEGGVVPERDLEVDGSL